MVCVKSGDLKRCLVASKELLFFFKTNKVIERVIVTINIEFCLLSVPLRWRMASLHSVGSSGKGRSMVL